MRREIWALDDVGATSDKNARVLFSSRTHGDVKRKPWSDQRMDVTEKMKYGNTPRRRFVPPSHGSHHGISPLEGVWLVPPGRIHRQAQHLSRLAGDFHAADPPRTES